MSEDDFWRSTPEELTALLGKIGERDEARERAAAQRAALIASEIHNAHRVNSRGQRMMYGKAVEPADYFAGPVRYVEGPILRDMIHGWLGEGAFKQ